jgi:hypothetical protein
MPLRRAHRARKFLMIDKISCAGIDFGLLRLSASREVRPEVGMGDGSQGVRESR